MGFKMTNIEIHQALYNRLFADRPTVDQAYEYAYTVAKASDCPVAVMTAVQVVVNTILNQLKDIK